MQTDSVSQFRTNPFTSVSGQQLPTHTKAWLGCYKPQTQPKLRLVCFAYAGGSAALYKSWQDQLGPHIEICAVELPGRGARFGEDLQTQLDPLLDDLVQILAPVTRGPYTLFGHSLGSFMAFHVMSALVERGYRAPLGFIAAGRHAPHRPSPIPEVAHLDDASIMRRIIDLDATPREILESPEFRDLFFPIVRADFALNETKRQVRKRQAGCPFLVLGGQNDKEAPVDCLSHWDDLTEGPTRHHIIDAGHFFVQSHESEVLAQVRSFLAPMMTEC